MRAVRTPAPGRPAGHRLAPVVGASSSLPPRHLTLQRITLVLRVPQTGLRATACRVHGARYVLCFEQPQRRPRFVTIPRTLLRAWIRTGVQIVARV